MSCSITTVVTFKIGIKFDELAAIFDSAEAEKIFFNNILTPDIEYSL
tara:strand:+ start:411 stop:551 length:141 start_codon:yes stop_codon:yes gene_type:complete